MIRNIISAAILLAALISMTSIVQIARAVEPELNLDYSAFESSWSVSSNAYSHPYAWTPNLNKQQQIIRLYEWLVLPPSVDRSSFSNDSDPRIFSFEIYQGDGLDDLRQRPNHHNTLPDEDTGAYGVSLKQWF
jgi:hypothetical protein